MERWRRIAGIASLLVLMGGLLAHADATQRQPATLEPVVGAAAVDDGWPVYTGVTPARLLDTRPGGSTADGVGARGGPFAGSRSLRVTGRGGVPDSGVGAVVLNVTVTQPASDGFTTVHPAGGTRPNASNVNFHRGATVPNAVLATVGDGGQVTIHNSASAHVIVDVAGWLPTGSSYTGMNPARLADSRSGRQTVDGLHSGEGAFKGSRPVSVLGRGGLPASGASAVVLNVTVTEAAAPGFVTVFPGGEHRPDTSNLNYGRGSTVANLVVADVGADGRVEIHNSGRSHLVVDVLGWFAADAEYGSTTPARLVDTRSGRATVDGDVVGGGAYRGTRSFPVLGRGGVPAADVGSVVLNVTITEPVGAGFASVFPTGEARPNASNVNFTAGRTVANLVVAKVGSDGEVSVHASAGAHVVVDVFGWLPIGVNQMDPNTVVAPPGSTSIADFDPDDTESPVVAAYDGPPLEEGDILATTLSDSAFYGTVTAIGGGQVTMEPATLMDIYPHLDLQFTADVETGAVEVATDHVGAPLVRMEPADGSGLHAGQAYKGSCSGSVHADVSAEVEVDAGTFEFGVQWQGWRGVGSATIAYNPRFEVAASAGLHAGGECSFDIGLLSRSLPAIKFAIGPVPVWINQKLDAQINGEISAQGAATVSASVSAGARLGGQYHRGSGFTLINESWANRKFTPELDVGADATIRVPVSYEAKAYGLVGFDATASPGLALEVRPLSDPWLTLDGVLAGDIRIKIAAKVGPVRFDIGHDFPTQEFLRRRLIELRRDSGTTTTTSTTSTTTTSTTTTLPDPDPDPPIGGPVRVAMTEGAAGFTSEFITDTPCPPAPEGFRAGLTAEDPSGAGIATFSATRGRLRAPANSPVGSVRFRIFCANYEDGVIYLGAARPTLKFPDVEVQVMGPRPRIQLSHTAASPGDVVTVTGRYDFPAATEHNRPTASLIVRRPEQLFPPRRNVTLQPDGSWTYELTIPETSEVGSKLEVWGTAQLVNLLPGCSSCEGEYITPYQVISIR